MVHRVKKEVHHPFALLSKDAKNAENEYIVFSPETGENTIHLALGAADGVLT